MSAVKDAEKKHMTVDFGGPESVGSTADDPLQAYLSLEEPRLVLDLRPDAFFHQAHLTNSYQIFPIAELKSRYSYLPPRNVPFLVIADHEQRKKVAEAFSSSPSARLLYLSEATTADLSEQGDVVDQEAFIGSAQRLGLVRASKSHQDRITAPGVEDAPRLLFRPSPAVRRTVLKLESSCNASQSLRVLDLGCGAARDLAWILHGSRTRPGAPRWTGIGVDNWRAALNRAGLLMEDLYLDEPYGSDTPRCEAMLWAKCSDAGHLEPLTGSGKGKPILSPSDDAELWQRYVALGLRPILPPAASSPKEKDSMQGQGFDLILSVRFHPRSLLPRLSPLVRTGGIVLLSHFVTLSPAERSEAAEAHPQATLDYDSPPHVGRIQPGEVQSLVETWNETVEEGCRWIIAEEILEPIEDGRIIKSVALRKIAC